MCGFFSIKSDNHILYTNYLKINYFPTLIFGWFSFSNIFTMNLLDLCILFEDDDNVIFVCEKLYT